MKNTDLGSGSVEWLGTHYRTTLTTAETGGAISVTDSVSPPETGPPRHVHHDADETFVILTGDAEFWLAGERFIRGPGETVFIPRGTEHTFRIVSETPSRHLVIMTPGGFEAFFVEMAAGQFQIPHDMPAIAESAAHHNLSFTGPPLSADEQ
jgi:mannose-6-phosphate isomerase-like protein (cupin superfamily)